MDRNKGLSSYIKPSEAEIIFPNVSMRVFHDAGINDEEEFSQALADISPFNL